MVTTAFVPTIAPLHVRVRLASPVAGPKLITRCNVAPPPENRAAVTTRVAQLTPHTTPETCAPPPPPPSFMEETIDTSLQTILLTGAALAIGVFGEVAAAHAVPEALVEAFKSKPSSLVHPVVMWLMVFGTGYTFYLGYKSSTVRTADAETRKELIKEKFSDRHYQTSSILFAITTIATFSGMANTYSRTGKLFPGPHLYIGLGLVAALSVMSSLVPYMKKGQEWARALHFTLAFFVTGMFGWQAKSGMVIVGKLLGWK